MVAGKLTRVVARPQDEVVRLRNHNQFFFFLATRHWLFQLSKNVLCHFSKFFPPAAGGKAVRGTGSKVLPTRKPLASARSSGWLGLR